MECKQSESLNVEPSCSKQTLGYSHRQTLNELHGRKLLNNLVYCFKRAFWYKWLAVQVV